MVRQVTSTRPPPSGTKRRWRLMPIRSRKTMCDSFTWVQNFFALDAFQDDRKAEPTPGAPLHFWVALVGGCPPTPPAALQAAECTGSLNPRESACGLIPGLQSPGPSGRRGRRDSAAPDATGVSEKSRIGPK